MKIQADVKFKVSVEVEVPDDATDKEIDELCTEEAVNQFKFSGEFYDIDVYEL